MRARTIIDRRRTDPYADAYPGWPSDRVTLGLRAVNAGRTWLVYRLTRRGRLTPARQTLLLLRMRDRQLSMRRLFIYSRRRKRKW